MRVAFLVATVGLVAACGTHPIQSTLPGPPTAEQLAELWTAPPAGRDLFYGIGGKTLAPDPSVSYTVVEIKRSGFSRGYTLKDPDGSEWSAKFPPEAPTEVTASRIVWGIGYHQPPIYFLPAFTLKDDLGKTVEVGGRFRLKDARLKETGLWKWEDNPFVGKKPYQGLIVLMMMFNSTDLKNTNNSLYEYRDGDLVQQWYVARDLGAALGDYNPISPRKNHPETFETVPYLLGVNNGHAQFAYNGWYKNLVRDRITPEEIAWASELLGRLSDKQWSDAFRAAGYEPAVANRFIAKLKEKVDQGRALGARAADRERQ